MRVPGRAARLAGNAPDVDAIVVANGASPYLDSAFWYLTGLRSGTFEGSFAVVNPDGSMDVAVSVMESETARRGKGRKHVYPTAARRKEIAGELLGGRKAIGVNAGKITHAHVEFLRKAAPEAEIVDVSDAFSKTVNVKDRKEVSTMRKACGIASEVAKSIPDILREGMTEREAAAAIDGAMRDLGADSNAFDTIAAFGPNSSQPHHKPGDRKLADGDAALFDFGCKYDMYCSDLTRTVFFGEPPKIMRKAYSVVRRAQEIGMAEMAPGAPASAPDLAAREYIDSTEFKGMFIHSFGHGLGMDIHEGIHVSSNSTHVFEAGNVVSAEPGVYVKGVGGIRIEDTVLITEKGPRRLTSFPKKLTVI
ncbi:MAG: aminopeptidase P family protein [Thermoplasmatales archaeon]|nr:aminopeptidase P family protein [Thermoplasmatales archaeon]